MRFSIALLALAALAAAVPNTRPFQAPNEIKTTGRLLVTLKKGANLRTFDRQLKADMSKDTSAGAGENVLIHQYSAGIKGYAGVFSSSMAQKLKAHPDVAAVEQDYIGYVDDIPTHDQQNPPSWGQSRIANRGLDLTKPYTYSTKAGEGVNAYIIDTGVDTKHAEFEGRSLVSTLSRTSPITMAMATAPTSLVPLLAPPLVSPRRPM
jgi:hypothetical protein